MAKRKDSVALFEVITATKRRQEAAAAAAGQPAPVRSALRTPKWWFKSKDKQPVPASSDAYAPPQLAAPVETPASEVAYAPAPAIVQRVALPPERVTIPERTGEVDPFGLDVPDRIERPRRSWLSIFSGGSKKVDLAPDRREVTLRFRYTTAIIIGFAVCVVVGLAYVTGRQNNKAAAGPNAISSDAIKRGPILPGVMNPEQNAREEIDEPAKVPPPPPKKADDAARGKPAAPAKRVGTNPGMPGPADGVETTLPRVNGLNYVIVQSYPEEKTAIEAQRVLEADGIPCTVEQSPKGWDPDWRSVVGIHGFPRVYKDTPAYKNYVRAIEATSKKFAGNSKFKEFQPFAIKWK